jgi:hypothetical protein
VRVTDIVGYVGPSRFALILPETPHTDADAVVHRLRGALGDLGARIRLGYASFPDESVTWVGLKALATERERPLDTYDLADPHAEAATLESALGERLPPPRRGGISIVRAAGDNDEEAAG